MTLFVWTNSRKLRKKLTFSIQDSSQGAIVFLDQKFELVSAFIIEFIWIIVIILFLAIIPILGAILAGLTILGAIISIPWYIYKRNVILEDFRQFLRHTI